jgi:phosphomannomutase
MTRTKSGEFTTVSGNQMGALLLDYAISQRKLLCKLPEYAYCIKSIVSTDMAYKIAEENGIKLHEIECTQVNNILERVDCLHLWYCRKLVSEILSGRTAWLNS